MWDIVHNHYEEMITSLVTGLWCLRMLSAGLSQPGMVTLAPMTRRSADITSSSTRCAPAQSSLALCFPVSVNFGENSAILLRVRCSGWSLMVLLGPLVVGWLHHQTRATLTGWPGRIAFLPPFEEIYPAKGQEECNRNNSFAFLCSVLRRDRRECADGA